MSKLKDHPLAELFPLMPPAEISELAADIKKNGLRAPGTLYDGKILDGRNRYRACELVGVDFKTRNHVSGSPLRFVVSANLHRRHLSESQRAMVAARLANLNVGKPDLIASIDAISQADAGQMLNVSRSSLTRARRVLGDKTLAKKVDSGEISVSAAAAAKAASKPSENSEIRDDTGYLVPPRALPYWNRKGEIEEMLSYISKARSHLRKFIPRPGEKNDPMFVETNLNAVVGDLNSAYTELEVSKPYAVCWSCQGQTISSCTLCKGRGVVSKHRFKCMPEELLAIRQKSCKK